MFPVPKQYQIQSIDKSLSWYVLWVNSRQYQTLKYQAFIGELLDTQAIWIPRRKLTLRPTDDCVEISEPLYPGYIFVGVKDISEIKAIELKVKNLSLAFYFLRATDGGYQKLRHEDMFDMLLSDRKYDTPDYTRGIQKGSKVKVTIGPFSGALGKVTSVSKRGITVNATFLNKNITVIVNRKNYLILEPTK